MRSTDSIVPLYGYGNSEEHTCGDGDVTETITQWGQLIEERALGVHGLDCQHHVGEDDQEVRNAESNKHVVKLIPHFPETRDRFDQLSKDNYYFGLLSI